MTVYDALKLPAQARIDRVVAKKQFYERGDLSPANKKLFDHVEKIYWRYALKTENTFIPSFVDKERDYPEIEVIEVVLRDAKQTNRLAEVIMRAIPYPMLLLFRDGEKIQLWMGQLRKNQADTSRMTLMGTEKTVWRTEDDVFWDTLSLQSAATANFCTLYEAWFDIISCSHLAEAGISVQDISGDVAREALERLRNIDREIASLCSQMKKESQFNRKMELDAQLQKLKKEKNKMIEQRSMEI